jgi:hypothetical protein
MSARYVCSFRNPKTGEHRDVMVSPDEFDQHDLAAIRYHRACDGDDQANFVEEGIVLRHAYQKVGQGYVHDQRPERRYLQ